MGFNDTRTLDAQGEKRETQTGLTGRDAGNPGDCTGPPSWCLLPGPTGYPSPTREKSLQKCNNSTWYSKIKKFVLYKTHHSSWKQNTHIVVCPQLQTTGTDAEHTGEKLIRTEELWNTEILSQVRKLFAKISRFLLKNPAQQWRASAGKQHQAAKSRLCISPYVRPLPGSEDSNSHPAISHHVKLQNTITTIMLYTQYLYNCYLTQEEVRVFSFRCPFHKFTEWQSPVNKPAELRPGLSLCISVCACVWGSSLVHKVFVKKVHLCDSGNVDLHFLIWSSLSEIFNCPLFQTWPQINPSQDGWFTLGGGGE